MITKQFLWIIQQQIVQLREAYLNFLQEYFANCFYGLDFVSYKDLHSVGAGTTKSALFFIMTEDFFHGWG
jgi:hypothetical protein